ncbi:MAG: histidinol-phosphate transaminase [Dehalococcoidia bacterium]
MEKFVNDYIKSLKDYEPVESDSTLRSKYSLGNKEIIRLNANENPYGSIEEINNNLSKISFHNYPDSSQSELRRYLSEYAGVDEENIVAGSGADEMIELIFKIYGKKDDALVDLQPTFGMYSFLATSMGMKVVSSPRNNDWSINLKQTTDLIKKNNSKLIFIASPNNPTGNVLTESEIKILLDTGIIIIIDETYYEFCSKSSAHLIDSYENIIVLRSFSKWAGIAGLRIGYMLSNKNVINNVFKIKQPYNVNLAAEIAAITTLNNKDKLISNIEKILLEKKSLEEFIENNTKISSFKSEGNFILCKFNNNDAEIVFNNLAKEGIFVRKFSDNLLKNYLRISIGKPDQMNKLKNIINNSL